jgi:hypothetical protein
MKILILPSKEILDTVSQSDKDDADFIAYRTTDLCKTFNSYEKSTHDLSVYRIVKNRVINNIAIKPHTEKTTFGWIQYSLEVYRG